MKVVTRGWFNVKKLKKKKYLRIVITDIILTENSQFSQPVAKYSTTYSAKLKQMMAICEGFKINADVHENI